jgi:hypothetical protein
MPLFSAAPRNWLAGKIGLAPNTLAAYEHFVSKLINEFGRRLVCDISEQDIADLQRARVREGKSARTVNFEINTLRQILKKHGLWNALIGHVTYMRARERNPDSATLGPGAAVERRRNRVGYFNGAEEQDRGWYGTDGALGEAIMQILNALAFTIPEREAGQLCVPRYSAGLAGNARRALFHNVDLSRPIGAWKKAWKIACESAGVRYRWHDCRHTFITRLAENPNVSEETIRALAGHVSKRMLERYSHIRLAAKEAAIADLERPASTLTTPQLARSADVLDHSPEAPTIARRDR